MEEKKLRELLPIALYKHAVKIRDKYQANPEYAAHYLKEFLSKSEYKSSNDKYILEIRKFIDKLKIQAEKEQNQPSPPPVDEKESLKRAISEYYLRSQLVNAILELGEIPTDPVETWIGVGFIDIADYSYISRWLSPKENQVVLNGLYSALKTVLDKHGGFLNKMEGDSMMFHFGGMIDPQIKGKPEVAVKSYIAKELFYSCIEIQRLCSLFNQASEEFLNQATDDETKQSLFDAFNIISNLRENLSFASAINALFQIRIRIGANIGEVCIGNFGPVGAKQWDIIGVPVIEAKRMESTAPIGGLRISKALYDQLDQDGITDSYLEEFKTIAAHNGGHFQNIGKPEMYKFAEVTLKDKKGRIFKTYSVQVDPELPEFLQDQVQVLLKMGQEGSDKIIEILQYYRGNKHIIQAIDDAFHYLGISIRKDLILQAINKKSYLKILEKCRQNTAKAGAFINKAYDLFAIFVCLGKYQDYLKNQQSEESENIVFQNFTQFYNQGQENIKKHFLESIQMSVRRHQFYNRIFPQVFLLIKSALLQYQNKMEDVESLARVENSA